MELYFEEGQVVTEELREKMLRAAGYAVETQRNHLFRSRFALFFSARTHRLNSEYRGIDRVTDVLSFPQFAALVDEVPEVGEICLGDVVICKDKAEAQAEEFGHSFERELVYLFVHSVLHLLGYDHEEENDKKIMRQREEEIMAYMELPR